MVKSFLLSLGRLFDKFVEQEQIESTFKFFIWLSAISILTKGSFALLYQDKLIPALITMLIVILLIIQLFSFGVLKIMIPFVEAVFPNTNLIKTKTLLLEIRPKKRFEIMIKLFFTWQTFVFLLAYLGLYRIMGQVFEALLILNR